MILRENQQSGDTRVWGSHYAKPAGSERSDQILATVGQSKGVVGEKSRVFTQFLSKKSHNHTLSYLFINQKYEITVNKVRNDEFDVLV